MPGRGSVSPGVRLPPFQALVDAHAAEIHRFLLASIGPAEADDCLQETLLSALRAYPRLRDGSNLRAWLYTIAQHKATDAVRRQHRHPTRALDGVEPALLGTAHAQEPTDDGLWRQVRSLPAKQRAAVIHRFVFDLGYKEIGARLACSEGAARQNVATGLRRLRMEVDR